MASFSKRIAFAVRRELVLARQCHHANQHAEAFSHLENAHVLGQRATYWHTRVHIEMLKWAVQNRSFRESRGQIMRIVGAFTKTALGWVPNGNTGGADVSPFAPMPLRDDHARKIQAALKSK